MSRFLLCIVLLGTSIALAQAPVGTTGEASRIDTARPADSTLLSPVKTDGLPARDATVQTDGHSDETPVVSRSAPDPDKARRYGSECGTNYLCGQNYATVNNSWHTSDVYYTNTEIGKTGRIVCDIFPPPGEAALTVPVGIVSFHGTYINDSSNGCTRDHHFQIKFYADNAGAPACNTPLATYSLAPVSAVKVGTLNFTGGTIPSDDYIFTVVLDPAPPVIASGWFSIAADSNNTTCRFLLSPTDEHTPDYWRYWMSDQPGSCGEQFTDDGSTGVQYCFLENKPGVCCDDRTALCDPNSNQYTCEEVINGRFAASPATCASINPACGSVLGACCKDDGTCTQTTYGACVGEGACCVGAVCTVYSEAACVARGGTYKGNGVSCTPSPCVIPYCPGDTNCDYTISYADINPFVRAITSESLWKTTFPGSTPPSGCTYLGVCDINGSTTVDYGDINPFVVRLQTPGPCPTRGSGPDKIQGNQWLGPNTLCTSCCTVIVDPGAPKENEPNDCGTDNYNAGCNSSPTTFTNLALNTWTYGESGTFGSGYHDTDWYTISLTGGVNHTLTIDFQAEFDVAVFLMHPGDCDANSPTGRSTLSTALASACDDPNATLLTSRCLPDGTYWVVVAPQAFSGVACGADYKIRVTDTTGCTICAITCPTSGTVYNELESCGSSTNGGCNDDPNLPGAFEFIGTDWSGTICGHTYAKYPYRDLDFYSFRISAPSNIKWDVQTEVPVRATILFQQDTAGNNLPPACGGSNLFWVSTLFTPCVFGSSSNFLYYPDPTDPNLPYWMLVMPEDATDAIFDGYPCGTWGTNENEYTIALTSTILSCPTFCSDSIWVAGDPVEGEPVCSTGYTDNFNFGCDKATPDPNKMLTLVDGQAICSQGGIFTKGTGQRPDYDWYKFTIPAGDNAQAYIETGGEFAYNLEIYYSSSQTCGTLALQERYTTAPCELLTLTSFCHTPGTYWVRVYAVGSTVTCGKTYVLRMTLTNQGCTQCQVTLPTCTSEGETCGTDINGGCDSTPTELYGTITCGQTICGNIWADSGANDTDYYRLVLSADKYIQWIADADFPAVVWLFESPLDCDGLSGDAEVAGPCNQVTHKILDINNQQILLPAGTYYIMVQPGTITGNTVTSITENYPCGAGRNNYWVQLQCSDNPLP